MAGWRPPQWANPAQVMITVPPASSSAPSQATILQQPSTSNGTLVVDNAAPSASTAPTTYVFDAVLSNDHEERIVKTEHPIQTGANINSHAYILPPKLSMLVGMSDVMDSYSSQQAPTQPPFITAFTGNPSKSVSAYQQMITLMESRQLLTVTTRLRTYKNMLLMAVLPNETYKTITGLHMRLEFEVALIASTSTSSGTPAQSALPNDTDTTTLGGINPQPPNASTVSQFGIGPATANVPDNANPNANMAYWLASNPQGVDVPGAGTYSSVNTNSLQQLAAP